MAKNENRMRNIRAEYRPRKSNYDPVYVNYFSANVVVDWSRCNTTMTQRIKRMLHGYAD